MPARAKIYELIYRRWRAHDEPPQPGYSLLLLVPGDLPVFLRLAMQVCGEQAAEDRVETIVLPDLAPSSFYEAFERFSESWSGGPIRVAPLRRAERAVARRRQNPHFNCWLQFKTGVNAARTSHAIWHDSDLFLGESDFLDRHYRTCRDRGLALLGVSDSWDVRYRENGYPHVVSTWELALDLSWVRGFRPWEHRGRVGTINGAHVDYDITFAPQTETSPERIARYDSQPPFLHFNYTTGRYRAFQRSLRRGEPWADDRFRVLLVRLLVDAIDDSGVTYEVPPVEELLRGIENPEAKVTYFGSTPRDYAGFRDKLQELVEGDYLHPAQVEALKQAARPFDEAFSWTSSSLRA